MVVNCGLKKLGPQRKEHFDRLVSRLVSSKARSCPGLPKQLFDSFWQSPDVEEWTRGFFTFWYRRVIRSRIPQLKAVVAKMAAQPSERLPQLHCFIPITNAVTEGFNSKNPSPAPRRPVASAASTITEFVSCSVVENLSLLP